VALVAAVLRPVGPLAAAVLLSFGFALALGGAVGEVARQEPNIRGAATSTVSDCKRWFAAL
jgi:hypothetical protein